MRKYFLSFGMAVFLLSMLVACGGSNAATDGDTEQQTCTNTSDCIGETYCNPATGFCEPFKTDGDGESETFTDCVDVVCPEGTTCEPTSDAQTEFACKPVADGDGELSEKEDDSCPYCCPIIATTPDAGGTLSFGALTSTSTSRGVVSIKNDSNNPNLVLKIYNFYIIDMKTGLPSQSFTIESLLLPSGSTFDWNIAKQAIERGEPIIELKQGQVVGVNLICTGVTIDTQLAQFTIISNACGTDAIRKTYLKSEFKGRAKIRVEYEDLNAGTADVFKVINGIDPISFDNVDLNSQPKIMRFRVYNGAWTSGDNKPLVVTSIGLREGFSPHFSVIGGPSDSSRWVIEADSYEEFSISYHPQKMASTFNPLVSTVQIANNSDDPLERLFEYDVSGSAEASALSVVPWPLDCGRTIAKDPSFRCSADGPTDPYNLTCPAGNCCPIYQQCLKKAGATSGTCYMPLDPQAIISNYTGANYLVTKVFFDAVKEDDTPGCKDHFYAPSYEDDQLSTDERFNSLEGQSLAAGASIGFPLYFHPAVPTGRTFKERCSLRISMTNQADSADNKTLNFDSVCTAVKENVPPVARLSPTSHGEEINSKIDNIPLDGTHNQLCFWADISYDPDVLDSDKTHCGGMDYTWLLTDGEGKELPFGAVTDVTLKDCPGRPSGPQIIARCYTFNRSGDYRLTMITTDDDGANSPPKVVNITINGNESMMAFLTFDCGSGGFMCTNTLDMRLRIKSPNMATCDEKSISSNNTFGFSGGSEGVCTFMDSQPNCQTGGNQENAFIRELKDGYWTFAVKYIDDCDALFTGLVSPICAGRVENNSFRLQLFTVSQGSTRTQIADLTGPITKDQEKSWRILREAGVFKKSTLEPTF